MNNKKVYGMKSLYVTSVERYSGKTAVCLALGKRFQGDGYDVGYFKPLSIQPWLEGGKIVDEDALFVKEVLNLTVPLSELSPVVVTQNLLNQQLIGKMEENLINQVKSAAKKAGNDKDILLMEGGGSLREGYILNLPTPEVAKALNSKVLVVVRYRDEIRLLDDVLAAKFRLGDSMCGIIINRVNSDGSEFVDKYARPYIEQQGVNVFGVLPEARTVAALLVDEIIDSLDSQVLTDCSTSEILVENITVGAMNVDAAISRLRRTKNNAVITGGDRIDIQVAALETKSACLILTGCLDPRPLIIKYANELGIPVLLVATNTMETIEAIDKVMGKTKMGQTLKLDQFQQLLADRVEFSRIYQCVELS
jgi:BioD-like phosphotransacetylase family protein